MANTVLYHKAISLIEYHAHDHHHHHLVTFLLIVLVDDHEAVIWFCCPLIILMDYRSTNQARLLHYQHAPPSLNS